MPKTNSHASAFLTLLTPDAPQEAPGLTIIPLMRTGDPAFVYSSMKKAFATGVLKVTEVSQGGSVPNLQVENVGDIAVLLLDGEEVAGAKQNRILNSSIMVDARGRLVVPVSCTEAGRWGYNTPDFKDSGYVAPRSVRAPKTRAVHDSLRSMGSHVADQGEVWNMIGNLRMSTGTDSPTSALRDSMEQTRPKVDEVIKAFPRLDGQVGLVVVCADGFVGMDAVSRPEVYADLHEKLIRSYATDVVARGAGESVTLDGQVDRFLGAVREAAEESFDSPGLGSDHRVQGEAVRGAALSCEDEVVHLGAFSVTDGGAGTPTGTSDRMHRGSWRG